MALIVQKYGGTSVGNLERIANVARRIKRWHDQGHQLCVVVSAMSGTTDQLISMARQLCPHPNERELDTLLATGEQVTIALLTIALHSIGVPAESFTGARAGILTDGTYTKARIRNISPDKVLATLAQGKVVIVAGFQGQNDEGYVTTLGRGGSDLSAIAMAAVLKADICQIYTDVDGVYTTDPRIVPEARKIRELCYDEMLEMASLGSKVMQSRSVEFAKKFGVIFEVRSSLNDSEGTVVKEETPDMESVVVRGVSLDRNQAKITVGGVPDKPGFAARIFTALAAASVNIDMIVQNVSEQGVTDISFTVSREELHKAQQVIEPIAREIGCKSTNAREGLAKVSVVGIGMRSHSGVAANMFEALAEKGINIEMISTSEIKISVIISETYAEEAVRAVHNKFGLGATDRRC